MTIYFRDNKKTIDFCVNEGSLNIWYLGLSRFIKRQDIKVKIRSVFNFFIFKLKLKLICKIQKYIDEFKGNNLIQNKMNQDEIDLFNSIFVYTKSNKIGLEDLLFVTILRLYTKINKIERNSIRI